jgi:hypothetical protein
MKLNAFLDSVVQFRVPEIGNLIREYWGKSFFSSNIESYIVLADLLLIVDILYILPKYFGLCQPYFLAMSLNF